MEASVAALWHWDRVAEYQEAEWEAVAERAADADQEEILQMARDDLWMREQCKAWHLREIARAAERSASRAVPGSSRYPAAVPGEITR
jgi:hypothetical protein